MEQINLPSAEDPFVGTPRCQSNPPRRILVAHDDGDLRQLSAEVLVRSGYHVDDAADVDSAWDALNNTHYDLLITAHNMPKVSGVELLQKLHAVRRALPVILTSPIPPKAEFNKNPWLHPATTLLMPYTVAEFLGTVQEVLRATDSAYEPPPPPCQPKAALTEEFQL